MTSLLPPTSIPKPNPTLILDDKWQVEFDPNSNAMFFDALELGYDNVRYLKEFLTTHFVHMAAYYENEKGYSNILKLHDFLEKHLIEMKAYYHEEQRTNCDVQLDIPGLEQLG